MPEDMDFELTQVSDSLFEKKTLHQKRSFRGYFFSHIDGPLLFDGKKKKMIFDR